MGSVDKDKVPKGRQWDREKFQVNDPIRRLAICGGLLVFLWGNGCSGPRAVFDQVAFIIC